MFLWCLSLFLFLCFSLLFFFFFFFNDTATTEIYTLSLHDALPILGLPLRIVGEGTHEAALRRMAGPTVRLDRKSTRLNSSHTVISYAVFCLKKKKKKKKKTKENKKTKNKI